MPRSKQVLRPHPLGMTIHRDLAYLLRTQRLVLRRDHPELASAIDYGVRIGEVTAVLPGVYATASMARLPRTRMQAILPDT